VDLNGDPKWVAKIMDLMDAVDNWIPIPARLTDTSFPYAC
jgi:elongation factor Tu